MDPILIFFVVMLLFLYLLLIRPQRQQAKRHQEMLGSLKVGDEVVTAGGIYGEITALDEERVQLEIDADVRIAVAKRAITSVVPPDHEREAEEDEPGAEADDYEGVTAAEPEPVSEEKARR
jgi:preprotein translocase subunit YajC